MAETRKVRVVLDTNIFIAAFWNRRSLSARILSACEEDRLELCLSPDILRELRRILTQARTSALYRQRVENLVEHAIIIEPEVRLAISPDPEDDKLLECAVTARADYLVTNDDHLLQFKEMAGTQIVKPGEFPRNLLVSR